MKDSFDAVTDVLNLLNVPALTGLLDGGSLWPGERPSDSAKRDVVVRSNGGNNSQDQTLFVQINAYAPNILSSINGKQQSLANQQALGILAKAIKPLVDGIYKDDFRCWIEEVPVLIKDADGSWFVNTSVRYMSIQDNYTNI